VIVSTFLRGGPMERASKQRAGKPLRSLAYSTSSSSPSVAGMT
jgi:hypothetical protein